MKKIIILPMILLVILISCDNKITLTALTIKNESSYTITDVLWNNTTFNNDQTNNSIKPGTSMTMEVQSGSGYIRFKPESNSIDMRTKDVIIIEKNEQKEFIFNNNTIVINENNSNDTGLLASFCGEVSFQNYSPASVRINNMTNERLVAFKGSISAANLLGGVPALADNHGLKRDASIFKSSEQYILFFITEHQYYENKNNLNQLENCEFYKLPVVYSASGNEWVYSISNLIGGSGRLMINNMTPFNVIIYKDCISGEILTYVSPKITNYIINLKAPMEYNIFPVIYFNNPVTHERISYYPIFQNNLLQGQAFNWLAYLNINSTYTINISDAVSNDFAMSTGGVFFRIKNNSATEIHFWQGNYLLTSANKYDSISKGAIEYYFIPFYKNPDGTQSISQIISNLKIGTAVNTLVIQDSLYEADYLYEITVTGTNDTNLQLSPVIKISKIDLNSIIEF